MPSRSTIKRFWSSSARRMGLSAALRGELDDDRAWLNQRGKLTPLRCLTTTVNRVDTEVDFTSRQLGYRGLLKRAEAAGESRDVPHRQALGGTASAEAVLESTLLASRSPSTNSAA